MCIYYSHWINLPDIFSSIKQNTQMPPLLLFSNCFIFSKRGTGSWRKNMLAPWRSPGQPLWVGKWEKAGGSWTSMGIRCRWGTGEGSESPQGQITSVSRSEGEAGTLCSGNNEPEDLGLNLFSSCWLRRCRSHWPPGGSGSYEMGSTHFTDMCSLHFLKSC